MNTSGRGRGKTTAPKSGAKKTSAAPKKKPGTAPKRNPASADAAGKKPFDKSKPFKPRERKGDPMPTFNEHEIRLNKYLSVAGIASRREADVLIQSGVISVNDVIITEMGHKIKPGDVVKYDGDTVNAESKRYVLLNKPKGFITTMDDPLGRKTVMSLVYKACRERIFPVGRLDKDTTGLLLFTNDGDLAKKLTHPLYRATKIYHVELNRPISVEHVEKLRTGIHLDDGITKCDKVEFIKDTASRELGIELHSGKNRIVRRLLEKLGYEIVKLDRVKFASLTKKDLPRGFYRHLTEQEVSFLKMS
jgi:23S rRNA pseudouridine2605 synthase